MKLKCPICKKPLNKNSIKNAAATQNKHFPFCSIRCKLLDLGQWLDQGYSIPTQNENDPDQADHDVDTENS